MPVFNAHIPAGRFSSEQKRRLADALNQSLVQGLGIPEGDRFIMISEHGKDELYLHPTFLDTIAGPTRRMRSSAVVKFEIPICSFSRTGIR